MNMPRTLLFIRAKGDLTILLKECRNLNMMAEFWVMEGVKFLN